MKIVPIFLSVVSIGLAACSSTALDAKSPKDVSPPQALSSEVLYKALPRVQSQSSKIKEEDAESIAVLFSENNAKVKNIETRDSIANLRVKYSIQLFDDGYPNDTAYVVRMNGSGGKLAKDHESKGGKHLDNMMIIIRERDGVVLYATAY